MVWCKTATLLIFSALLATGAAAAEPTAFRVQVTGKGKPMILIPGLSCSGEVWDSALPRFQKSYQMHVLTLAGFAGVPRVPAPFIETVRKELVAYIKDKKLERPVVVGHSLGGSIALALAGADPDLVGPLVIVDSMPFFGMLQGPDATAEKLKPMAEGMRKGMASMSREQYAESSRKFFAPMVTKPADLDMIAKWVAATDPSAAGDAMYDIWVSDLRPGCARIVTPALVLGSWAAYKEQATRQQVEKNFRTAFSTLKGVRILLHDTARHFLMLDDPDWTYGEMAKFLGEAR